MDTMKLYAVLGILRPMADNNTTKQSTDIQANAWLDAPSTKIGGAAFAVGATVVTARDAISRGFFKTMNKAGSDTLGGAFADLQLERDDKINAITSPAKQGVRVANATAEVERINREYHTALNTRMELLEVNNVLGKWQTLKPHQRMEVGFTTAAVASVAVGAILAITTSHNKDKADMAREQSRNMERA